MDIAALPPVFWEIHDGNPREGPGCREATRRAFAMVQGLPARPRVLDIGCGPGAQTLDLAECTGGRVMAVDFHLPFLGALRESARRDSRAGRVGCIAADMKVLPFPDGAFDLAWAEGSIYLFGFEEGLRDWRRLLRPGGCVAVTEAAWLRPDPPPDLRAFWAAAYPDIRDAEANVERLRRAGYHPLGHFPLPETAWWNYYGPILARLPELRERHAGDPEALAAIEAEDEEIALYRRYSAYYGYVFYIGKRED